MSAMPAASLPASSSLLNSPLSRNSSGIELSSQYIPSATASFSSEIASLQGSKIINNAKHTSRRMKFIFTYVMSGKPTKASISQRTPDRCSNSQGNSMSLSTSFNGIVIKDTTRAPSESLRSQTETSNTMSTATPFYILNQTLSIVSSPSDILHTHQAKSLGGILSEPTSGESQTVNFTTDSSRKAIFSKTAEIRLLTTRTMQTAAFKTKGFNTMFRVNPSLTMESSSLSETEESHSLHIKEPPIFEQTMRMRGSLTTKETGVSKASTFLASKSLPNVMSHLGPLSPGTLLRRRQSLTTKETMTSTDISKAPAFSVSKSESSLDSEKHSSSTTTRHIRPIFSIKGSVLPTRTSAALELSTTTSNDLPDVTKSMSSSEEMRSIPRGYPQASGEDSLVWTADVVVSVYTCKNVNYDWETSAN
jgi:hypothetical protein